MSQASFQGAPDPLVFEALGELNRRIASIFRQEARDIRFVFLSYIANPKRRGIVLGLSVIRLPQGVEVQLLYQPGWHRTAVHELVHIYNGGVSEKKVKEITRDVIALLKRNHPPGLPGVVA